MGLGFIIKSSPPRQSDTLQNAHVHARAKYTIAANLSSLVL